VALYKSYAFTYVTFSASTALRSGEGARGATAHGSAVLWGPQLKILCGVCYVTETCKIWVLAATEIYSNLLIAKIVGLVKLDSVN